MKLKFRRRLLAWYDGQARALPWRESRDPYRVWVSEIMLQQTRVAAVIGHYREFLRRFPSLDKLARAREPAVLAAWSGLGYYRRARMMHGAAKVIVREHGGEFPESVEGLRALPGIGRYTAAAIASIAFGEAAAVVDGNVERVLQRVLGRRMAGEELWRAAEELLEAKRPGDFNQAMMELGAVVCTPRSPGCLTCPVVELCATRGELAGAGRGARQRKREIQYLLDWRDGRVFLVQRAKDASLMAGMWELPEVAGAVVGAGGKQVPLPRFATRRNDKNNHDDKNNLDGGNERDGRSKRDAGQQPWFTVRHSITVTDYTVRVRRGRSSGVAGKWIAVGRLERVALTGLARKILRRAGVL